MPRKTLATLLAAAFVILSTAAAHADGSVPAVTTPQSTTTTTAAPAPATTSTTVAPAPPVPTAAEARARLMQLTNAERTQRGLAPLSPRDDVTGVASGWSSSMADAGGLSHNDDYFSDDSRRRLGAGVLGENVARAGSIDDAHRALMASEHHRANILDGRFAVVGFGATFRDGTWWVTEDFLQPRTAPAAAAPPAPASAPEAATPPATAPVRRAPRPAPAPAPVRSTHPVARPVSVPTITIQLDDTAPQVLAATAPRPAPVRAAGAAPTGTVSARWSAVAVALLLLGAVLALHRARRAIA